MTARSTFQTSVANNHTTAEVGGVSFNTGATVAPIGNATTWSRQSAVAAVNSGAITRGQFVNVMQALVCWEQEQRNIAHDTLRATDTDIV